MVGSSVRKPESGRTSGEPGPVAATTSSTADQMAAGGPPGGRRGARGHQLPPPPQTTRPGRHGSTDASEGPADRRFIHTSAGGEEERPGAEVGQDVLVGA